MHVSCWAPERITKTTNQKLWNERQNCLHLSKAAWLSSINKAGHAETLQPSLAAARPPWTTSWGALKLTGQRSQHADQRISPSKQRMPSCDPPDQVLAFPPDKLLLKTASMSARTPSPDAPRPRASVDESACANPAFSNITRSENRILLHSSLHEKQFLANSKRRTLWRSRRHKRFLLRKP